MRTYDSLSIGDSLKAETNAPISRRTLALFAGASGDHNPIHIDLDFAKEAGMNDVFAHGMLIMAYLGKALGEWFPNSTLKEFGNRFTEITQLKSEITWLGEVIGKFEENDQKLVRLKIEATDQDGNIKLSGQALVALS